MQTRCTFTTAHDVTLFPIELTEARQLTGAALAAAGLARRREAKAAFVLDPTMAASGLSAIWRWIGWSCT